MRSEKGWATGTRGPPLLCMSLLRFPQDRPPQVDILCVPVPVPERKRAATQSEYDVALISVLLR